MGFFGDDVPDCGKRKLSETCSSPRLQHIGTGGKRVLILVDAPTAAEDAEGGLSFAAVDSLILSTLRQAGLKPETDCWKATALKCCPAKGKEIKAAEIRACGHNLRKLVKQLRPEKILCFGKTSLDALIGDRMSVTAFGKWTGWQIPDKELQTIIYPIYSPGQIRAQCKNLNVSEPLYRHFVELIQAAVQHKPEKEVHDFKGFHYQLDNLKKITWGIWAVDFETTGLKPYADGHEIVCVSFSDGTNTLCIKMGPEVKQELQRIFTSPDIKLVAHNMKFEDLWAREALGIQITNWYWDTMLAAHCMDNRSGIAGLKFQTYVNFGTAGYEKEVNKYLEAPGKSANDFNTVKQAPEKLLHWYCAMDSFYTFQLFVRQFDKVPPGYFLFLEGAKELSLVESNGIAMDVQRIQKQRRLLTARAQETRQEIDNNPDVVAWKSANEKDFNYNSPVQLRSFFTAQGERLQKVTAKGADSTDRESLEGFRHPVARLILEARASEKLEGTFLAGLETEQTQGMLHSFYSLGLVSTYRSSSSNPNFQNFPKRDPRAQRVIRGNFRPRPGRQLLEVDYSGIEVRIAACYTHDKNLIRYIEDPETDMHRDVAALIFKLPAEEITKEMRYFGKNGFVFPQFYGSYWKQCAENIWKDITPEMRAGLKARGIKTLSQFETHIQEIEDNFWNVRFREYSAWKRKQWENYLRKGHIESHTGFRYTGIMNRKEVSNYPIQGSAFHCLLWSLIQVNRWLRKRNMQTMIVGTIHDSIILDVVPEEMQSVKKKLRQIMTEDLRAHWDWIVVPLDVEMEASAVNGNWYEMHPEPV